MRILEKTIIYLMMLATTSSAAMAATHSKKSVHGKKAAERTIPHGMTKKPPMQTGAKLSTDMHFDELNVHGRYQAGDEGYAVVEDEKALDDLLDYRKDYKDRLKKSRLQR